MNKDSILTILVSMKALAKIDFNQLSKKETKESEQYQKGYLDALDMVYDQFKEKMKQ